MSWEDGYDNWKLAYPPEYDEDREPGCECGEGDDPCPLHGEGEPDDSADCAREDAADAERDDRLTGDR